MNSFSLHAVGTLADDPEEMVHGPKTWTRFILVGNDYAGKDEGGPPREVVTNLSFTAFGAVGQAIARNSRKGDQLMVEARVGSHLDRKTNRNEPVFIVQGFRFGAPGRTKREELEASGEDEGEEEAPGEIP